MWVTLSSTKWSPGVSVPLHRLQLLHTYNSHKCNLYHQLCSYWQCFFITSDLADMVHTYKGKTLPPSYSKEDLNTALEIVKSGRMTICRAAKLYKISKATLFKHVKGSRGVKGQMLGLPTAVPFHEEKQIAECLKLIEKWGFDLSKKKFWG